MDTVGDKYSNEHIVDAVLEDYSCSNIKPYLERFKYLFRFNKHTLNKKGYNIESWRLRRLFGTRTQHHIRVFEELNAQHNLFDVDERYRPTGIGGKGRGYTKCYVPSRKFLNILKAIFKKTSIDMKQYREHISDKNLLDVDYYMTKGSGLIDEYEINKINIGLHINSIIPINKEAAADILYNNEINNGADVLNSNRLLKILSKAFNEHSNLYCLYSLFYETSSTGRYYNDIQNLKSEWRNKIIVHNYRYDIVNCHFTIAYMIAKKLKYVATSLAIYMYNTEQVRETLANELDISVKMIKNILLVLLGGGTLKHQGGIYYLLVNKLNIDSADEIIKKIQKNKFITALRKDMSKIKHLLIKNIDNLVDDTPKTLMSESKNKIFAYILQNIESNILAKLLKVYKEKIIFIIHDGFYTLEDIDVIDIEGELRKSVGYSIQIKKTKNNKQHLPCSIS